MSVPLDRRRWLAACAAGCFAPVLPVPAQAGAARARVPVPAVLAVDDDGTIDPARCLASEKLDGVRALWDGQTLRSRNGLAFEAPRAFVAALPAGTPLDGELWSGRGRFEAVAGVVRRRDPAVGAWSDVRYVLFELPHAGGPFHERARRLTAIAARHGGPLVAAEQTRLADRAALAARLASVVAAGGEGLVLHRADASFVAGRTADLVKVKPVDDAEAVVVAHRPGNGRLAGRIGALDVVDEAGRRFRVGSGLADALRDAPPAVGSRIVYRHRGRTANGLPRFPTYWRRALEA